jgi:hypothetical protein
MAGMVKRFQFRLRDLLLLTTALSIGTGLARLAFWFWSMEPGYPHGSIERHLDHCQELDTPTFGRKARQHGSGHNLKSSNTPLAH